MPVERRTQISSRSWCRGVPKKVADHGVAPEGCMPIERRTQNGSRSCEEQVRKGISHLA
jgi:hypothetical protein